MDIGALEEDDDYIFALEEMDDEEEVTPESQEIELVALLNNADAEEVAEMPREKPWQ